MYTTGYYMTTTQLYPQKACFTVRQSIPGIHHAYTRQRSLASPLSFPSSLGSLGPGLLADLFSLGHREPAHARLGAAKIPQPGVDLVYMAAPPRGRACTIGKVALKGDLLSATVLMWTSRGCIPVQKACSSETVLNPSDVESRNRGGLVHLVDSVRFHRSSSLESSSKPESKALKKTKSSGMSSSEQLQRP
jgi:hypothetical protein